MNFTERTNPEAKVFFTVGFVDISGPPTGIYAAYHFYSGKKDICTMPLHRHIVLPKTNEIVRKTILDYVGKV